MKQVIPFFLLILFSYPVIRGQTYIAPKGGINGIANFSQESGVDFSVNSGYQFGIEIGTKWKDIIGLRAELMYANESFQQSKERIFPSGQGQDVLFRESVDIDNGSVELAVSALITLGEGFELSVGPQLQFLLASGADGSWDFAPSGIDSATLVEYDYIDDEAGEGAYWNFAQKDGNYFNNSQLGLNLGLNINLIRNFFVEVKTNYAFTDLVNDFYLEEGDMISRNFDVILNGSYRIPLKKKKAPKQRQHPFGL